MKNPFLLLQDAGCCQSSVLSFGKRRRDFLLLIFAVATVAIWVLLASLESRPSAAPGLRLLVRQRCPTTTTTNHDKDGDGWVVPRHAQAFNADNAASNARDLIVVAGHSVTVSGHLRDAHRDEADWYLLPYQRHTGLPNAIVAHISAGIAAAAANPRALLVFSGGATRAATGPDTEGASYYRVADAMQLWNNTSHDNASHRNLQHMNINSKNDEANVIDNNKNNEIDDPVSHYTNTVRARTITEEFATDSFQNLLFSICRFHEVTGVYPESITMVSFTFKQRRFETLHVPALQWPSTKFSFVGRDSPPSTGFDLAASTRGEAEQAARPFEADPYGCHSAVLREKRRSRNPFARTPPYALSCPDMAELLHYCGPDLIAPSRVPWGR